MLIFSVLIIGCQKNKSENLKNLPNNCTDGENIDLKDINEITVNSNIYYSVQLVIKENDDLEKIVKIINSDMRNTINNIEFSSIDTKYHIDIICESKIIQIKVLAKNEDFYYIINNKIYNCSKRNYLLLSDFIMNKYVDYVSKVGLDDTKSLR